MNTGASLPIILFAGTSGSGKTTVREKVITEFPRRGYKIGTIKHHKHGFEMDHPGKDSWRHKKAGASRAVISSPQKVGMVMDVDHDHDPSELAAFFSGMEYSPPSRWKMPFPCSLMSTLSAFDHPANFLG